MDAPKHVAIIGGGIAGLSAALAAQEAATASGLSLSCTVIEAGREWGGKITTHRRGDFLIEGGPDSFLSQKPGGLELCAKLGLTDRLINTNEHQKKTFVYSRGRLRELPQGLVVIVPTQLGPFLRSGLLSWAGLVRMGLDLLLPARRRTGEESVAAFFRRRLGREAFERVVEPLLAGIYAGDAERLSLQATFPRFADIERAHGSVIRGMLAGRGVADGTAASRGSERTMFVTLRNGLGELVEALVARVTAGGARLLSEHRVASVRVRSRELGRWTYDLVLEPGGVVSADAVVLATPAYVSAELIRPLAPIAAGLLAEIPYASTATVSLAYPADALAGRARGFGFVVPRVENRDLIAVTWTSLKWPHRAPASHMLVRGYLGRVGRDAILQTDDETLVRCVREELAAMTGITSVPEYVEVHRWARAMPQYT
ncbi:MAG: protoporphyrinogen oxidase, partial [Nitrospirales bacterium]